MLYLPRLKTTNVDTKLGRQEKRTHLDTKDSNTIFSGIDKIIRKIKRNSNVHMNILKSNRINACKNVYPLVVSSAELVLYRLGSYFSIKYI